MIVNEYPTIIIYPDLDKPILAYLITFGTLGVDYLPDTIPLLLLIENRN